MTKTYHFDGANRTLKEIQAIVPLIKDYDTLRRHLDAGRNTKAAVIVYNPAVRRASASARMSNQLGRTWIYGSRVRAA